MELLSHLKPQLSAAVWNDRTRWSSLLSSPVRTEQHYLERALRAPVDVASRAAAAAAILEGVSEPASAAVAPLRAGPVATDSIAVFRQLLHAALAGHHASQIAAAADVSTAMTSAGTAWRHLQTAGEWQHEEHLRPPQLALPFRRALELAVLLLTYERLASMPLGACDEARHRRRVELLQAAVACNAPTAVRRWAVPLLGVAVAEFWATYHHDPRVAGAPPSERNACAVVKALSPVASQKAEHFVRMHEAVHGIVASSGGDPERLLLSTAPAAVIVNTALPHEALKGETALPGVRTFQQVGMIAAPDGAQPIVPAGGVVMTARDADRCNARPLSLSLPTLRMPRLWPTSAAPPLRAPPALAAEPLAFTL